MLFFFSLLCAPLLEGERQRRKGGETKETKTKICEAGEPCRVYHKNTRSKKKKKLETIKIRCQM